MFDVLCALRLNGAVLPSIRKNCLQVSWMGQGGTENTTNTVQIKIEIEIYSIKH